MNSPRIALLVPTFQPRDAVGNDVLGMYNIFRAARYPTSIFAQHIHPEYASITNQIKGYDRHRWGDILVYHHAIHWPLGEQILSHTRNRTVIKYHNVTPPQFYVNYA